MLRASHKRRRTKEEIEAERVAAAKKDTALEDMMKDIAEIKRMNTQL
jgi:hypothetical protein